MIPAYQILMIDPPWPKKKGCIRKVRPGQSRLLDYETMTLNEIFNLLDRDILPVNMTHCVFMWCVEQFLTDCEQQMAKRGYKRHCRFIWNKMNGVAPAFTIRFSHEYLIWYYKPGFLPVAADQRGVFKSVFSERARQHSRKPEAAYTMIDKLFPALSKIDVFSREKRAGWAQYGDQPEHFN